MSTRTPRPPIDVMTCRSALAVRPPRPITVPRSSGCTRTSRRWPRRESISRTRTSSGCSTIPLTRCSSAGRSVLSGLGGGVGTGLTLGCDGGLLEQALDRLARLRADPEPVLRALRVDLDDRRVVLRLVDADELDRLAVALGARVGDDDAVLRVADLAHPQKPDLDGH